MCNYICGIPHVQLCIRDTVCMVMHMIFLRSSSFCVFESFWPIETIEHVNISVLLIVLVPVVGNTKICFH